MEANFAAERLTTALQSAEKHAKSIEEILDSMRAAGVKPTKEQLMTMWHLVEKFQDAYSVVEALKRS